MHDAYTFKVPVPSPASDILAKLAEGWVPECSFPESNPLEVKWGGCDISDTARQISRKGSKLQITGELQTSNLSQEDLYEPHRELDKVLESKQGEAIEAVFSDGIVVTVEEAYLGPRNGTGEKKGEFQAYSSQFIIIGEPWKLMVNEKKAQIWIGRIHGNIEFQHGNLTIQMSQGFRSGLLRLQGQYTYYLVEHGNVKGTWYLIIDTSNYTPPDRQTLYQDFLLLQFALGRNLYVELLLGVTTEGDVVAMESAGYGKPISEEARGYQTVLLFSYKTWVSAFFELASRAYAEHPEHELYIPFAFFLDALSDHMHGSYIRLQIALEALAYNVLHGKPSSETEIVTDKKAWKDWVAGHEVEIQKFAKEGFEKSLLGKVRESYRLASGRVVPNAFKSFGMNLNEEMKEELERRDVAIHTASFVKKGQKDRTFAQDLRSQALVRTMLVALVAKVVDYKGPILGWEKRPTGEYLQADSAWWPVNELEHSSAGLEYVAGLTLLKIGHTEVAYKKSTLKGIISVYLLIQGHHYFFSVDSEYRLLDSVEILPHHKQLFDEAANSILREVVP